MTKNCKITILRRLRWFLFMLILGCTTVEAPVTPLTTSHSAASEEDYMPLILFAAEHPDGKILIKPSADDYLSIDRNVKAFFEDLRRKNGDYITIAQSTSLRALTGKGYPLDGIRFRETCRLLNYKYILTYGTTTGDRRLYVEIYSLIQPEKGALLREKINSVKFGRRDDKVPWENETEIVTSRFAITNQVSMLLGNAMERFKKTTKNFCNVKGFVLPHADINEVQFRHAFLGYFQKDCLELKPVIEDWQGTEKQLVKRVRETANMYGIKFKIETQNLNIGQDKYRMYYLRTIVYDSSGPKENLEFLDSFLSKLVPNLIGALYDPQGIAQYAARLTVRPVRTRNVQDIGRILEQEPSPASHCRQGCPITILVGLYDPSTEEKLLLDIVNRAIHTGANNSGPDNINLQGHIEEEITTLSFHYEDMNINEYKSEYHADLVAVENYKRLFSFSFVCEGPQSKRRNDAVRYGRETLEEKAREEFYRRFNY